ncbi:MAG: hypothetical protein ACK5LX_02195 [Oscillospiraceae bacterium]
MEWSIVSVLVVLVGLFVTIGAPIIRLISSITKLTSSVEFLRENMEDLTKRNSDTHGRIFVQLDEHDKTLSDHETRLVLMERK